MTTSLDSALRPVAKALLSSFGSNVTIRREAGSVSGSTLAVSSSLTSQTVKASPPAPYEKRFVDGSSVMSSDVFTLIAATDAGLTFDPKPGDLVSFDSGHFRVVAVTPYRSGDLVAAFGLQLRGVS